MCLHCVCVCVCARVRVCVCVCVRVRVRHGEQLLRRNPERRLGSGEKDAEEVKKQPFFRVRRLYLFFFRVVFQSHSRKQTTPQTHEADFKRLGCSVLPWP